MPKESTTEIETAYREYRSTVLEIYRHIVLSKFSAEKLSRKKISEMEAALQDELTSLLGHLDTVVWDRSDSGTPPFRLKLPSGEVVNKVSVLEKYVSKLMPDLEREYQAAKSPPILSWQDCKYGEFTAPGEEQDKLKELFHKQWEEYKETYKELFLEEAEGENTGTSPKKTLSVADIITDPRVCIGRSWFSKLKKRIPLPDGDTMKDYGEAWSDGEDIIQKIIQFRKKNPRKPPTNPKAKTAGKSPPSRKKKNPPI